MATFSRVLLSGSTNGRPINVAANATPGTSIHASITSTSAFDEIYAWATNVTSSAATLYVEWGATGSTQALVQAYSISANSAPVPIATGQVLNGNVSAAAFCSATSAINITGFVNRIV